ncbi:MAG TPA: N-acetylmuramoyl-L-alanine amidase [Acidobacteriaceae bacterium]|jgi:N-acetylmuramoyl-L-alanine amidase|nr:N-acetylmuramoyl-L-alanine amidase [Acidobacteriaceae bacterium]
MRSPSNPMPARLLFSSAGRGVFPAVVAVAFALLASPAIAAHRHGSSAMRTLTPFARAEQLRDALESRPESSRTLNDYQRVMDAYRSVYHSNPADPKAPEAVNMVAGLLAEEGRIFHREQTLLSAIGQFEFLRTQYPASPYRASALLAEAAIFLHDLHDPAAAKGAYVKFLSSYPRDPLAAQARAGLNEIDHQKRRKRAEPPDASQDDVAENSSDEQPEAVRPSTNRPSTPLAFGTANSPGTMQSGSSPHATAARHAVTGNAHVNELTPLMREELPEANRNAVASQGDMQPGAISKPATDAAQGQPVLTGAVRAAAQEHHGRLPLVTNVRHWSTPVYTRVAIDLQDQVEYEAARVPNPDRIYFDLHGARVAPELIGRTMDVTDDGFLERIRVAQFSNDVTRIVLDVNQVTEYSAFFLPNPWRLIIDIHGGDVHSRRPASEPPQQVASMPAASSGTQPNVRPPEPVSTSNQSSRQATRALRDIAAVSTPDQVKATSRPTTQPIAASVSPLSSEKTPPEMASASAASGPSPSSFTHTTAKSNASHRTPSNATADEGEDEAGGYRSPSHEASSTLDGQRSLTRALGLKIGRIVVDAGHGGHDSGTLGPGGIQEKEVVLDVALRLGKLLRQRMGADVIYTRDDDTFVPLEERTAIANKAQADLFISVHANSSSDPTARGVETYYLNFTTSPDALEVAARENAVSDESIHELSGLVKKITLKDKIDESREFAADVNGSLYGGLERGNPGMRDRGVKKAPFVVLIGANMPSILAEISFLTNPDDATQLRDPQYRERIAESLYRGVAKYVSGLSGLRVAQNSRIPGN